MERLSSAKRDVAAYAVVLLIAAFLFYHALGIMTYSGTYLGPELWPEIILGLAIITCVIALATRSYRLWQLTHLPRPTAAFPSLGQPEIPALKGTSRPAGESRELPASQPEAVAASSKWAPWIAAVLTGAYIYLLPRVGYFLDTALYVTAFIYFGNFRKLRIAALLGVGASLVFMIIFMKLVYISLPVGEGPFEHISTFVMAALAIH